MFGISMIASIAFVLLLSISYFIYYKKPENIILMYIPSGVIFIGSSFAVLYSFYVSGFEGMGIAFISITTGIASLLTCIVLTIIVMIKQSKHKK
ncbi:hypothetical protein EEL32_15260 [Brevibacillus laterosporus]|uniref:Uncharacterized protein n=1 Tax=Brevibacillus laterosporus TaxID=1465 RepID=A0A502H5S6_BRELA|nr:hypothetical protein EEL30_03035 [Brevibacillus laterosporus]TPG69811.1 hypothetical protein EEL31_15835 [Brevibacillus laterosporus]TPG84996.1 hypothetical protein EEL32_15260 [Brevibacillus laterosporus]